MFADNSQRRDTDTEWSGNPTLGPVSREKHDWKRAEIDRTHSQEHGGEVSEGERV